MAGNNIGSNLNEWREPVCEFNANELSHFQSKNEIRGFSISDQNWKTCTAAADKALNVVWKNLQKVTNRKYPEITVQRLIRQGSSREGLKVMQPDEFDCVLEFSINGLRYSEKSIRSSGGHIIPGHLYLEVNHSKDELRSKFPNLFREDVFSPYDRKFVLDTENLQTKVFTSILEATIGEVEKDISPYPGRELFKIVKRKIIPPTFCFGIEINHTVNDDPFGRMNTVFSENQSRLESSAWTNTHKLIEFDMVPALVLDTDRIPDPYTVRSARVQYMDCYRYAVMKWIHKKMDTSPYGNVDTSAIWRESTCGYEKHIFDVSRRNVSQRYVLTACRVLKGYLRNLETRCPHNQLLKVATTYRIKNLCIHCLLLLTIPSNEKSLSGVKEALSYLLVFLQMSLERRFLPHFFYGNVHLLQMFPESLHILQSGKMDTFADVQRDTLSQATSSMQQLFGELRGLYMETGTLNQTALRQFSELLD